MPNGNFSTCSCSNFNRNDSLLLVPAFFLSLRVPFDEDSDSLSTRLLPLWDTKGSGLWNYPSLCSLGPTGSENSCFAQSSVHAPEPCCGARWPLCTCQCLWVWPTLQLWLQGARPAWITMQESNCNQVFSTWNSPLNGHRWHPHRRTN